MNFLYQFSIDVYSASVVTGWIRHRFLVNKSITIQFYLDDGLLGESKANLLREDVKAQNLHPTGLCGFSFSLPDGFTKQLQNSHLRLVVKETGTALTTLAPEHLGLAPRAKSGWRKFATPFFRTQKNENIVFFMHIPKTAGTSFNSFARTLYGPQATINHIEAFDRSEFSSLNQDYSFISGHLRMDSVLESFNSQEINLFTIVREPYAHLHSHLNWLRGIGKNRESDFYKSHHEILKGLADQFGERDTLTYAELQALVDSISGVSRRLLDNNQARHFLLSDPETVCEAHWEEVDENSRRFAMIGITEKYSEFKKKFCNVYGFKEPATPKVLNQARYEPLYDINDPATREIVAPLVAMDQRLYTVVSQNW